MSMQDVLISRGTGTDWRRESLEARRAAIAASHARGATGVEVVAALTALADEILLDLYQDACVEEAPSPSLLSGGERAMERGLCLVALGGYGRRELAPYSDIDLMFLFAPSQEAKARSVSTAILHALWDLGFQVGHSLRTTADCMAMGRTDLTIRTALMEARLLAGDQRLFDEFKRMYRAQVVGKTAKEFLVRKREERQREYGRFGATNFLLEPNLKKGRGGLRDLHLLKWTAMARYGTASFDDLVRDRVLSTGDATALGEAQNFLWRVRNELHFYAGRAQDILTFDEQIRIAGLWGFRDTQHLLSVEQFMQQYYRHSTRVADVTNQFVSRTMIRSVWQRLAVWLPARQIERFFALTRDAITVPGNLREEFLADGSRILRLFQLAQLYGLAVSDELIQELPERLAAVPDSAFLSEAASGSFLAILTGPGHVADTLTAMHRVRLLERLIPVFGPVRGLMQFNAYHKYTVDHHSLLAVGQAEAIGAGNSLLSHVYREIKRKDLLHLAVLLHDLGKGQAEDHSLIGERIARDTAARLRLGDHDSELLSFLVRFHLLMANTAFRRDPSDEKVVLRFARQVGTPEVLKMLFVLTAADISAVGPGVLTPWKETLLGELYLKSLNELAGEEGVEAADALRLRRQEVRQAVIRLVGKRLPLEWLDRQLETWPDRSLVAMPAERIATHLEWVSRLSSTPVLVDSQHDVALGVTEYTVYTRDGLTPGIFSKIAGVLAAKGAQILDAQIATLADGIVVDVFRVLDPDCPDTHHPRRVRDISETIVAVLEGRREVEALLQEATRFGAGRQGVPLREPTVVQVDNETSDQYTIIDVFADDRQGLLYAITRAIFDLGLSVHAARISTKLDQVVDVFYVTDQAGAKVNDPQWCEVMRETITTRIEEYLGGVQTTRPVVHRVLITRG